MSSWHAETPPTAFFLPHNENIIVKGKLLAGKSCQILRVEGAVRIGWCLFLEDESNSLRELPTPEWLMKYTCVCKRKLLERVVLHPRARVSSYSSAPNHWEVSQATGRATEAEEGLQKQQERLRSYSWGIACFWDPKANFLIHSWVEVSRPLLSVLLAGFDLIWENTQADGETECFKEKEIRLSPSFWDTCMVCALHQQVTFQTGCRAALKFLANDPIELFRSGLDFQTRHSLRNKACIKKKYTKSSKKNPNPTLCFHSV